MVVRLLFVLLGIPALLFSQNTAILHIKKASEKIIIDGILNESDWNIAETATGFWQHYPNDTSKALQQTEVKVTYDDNFFYVAATCFDNNTNTFVVQSLKRDFWYNENDAFAIYIDPFQDKQNGVNFTVSPMGVQSEGLIANGGGWGISKDWDNQWLVEVKVYEDKWVAEFAIPFTSIRYKENSSVWNINFSRNNLKTNESSVWSKIPRVFNVSSLAFSGELIWDAPPKKSGGSVSLIPYGIGNVSQDFENDSVARIKANAGVDAKILVSSSLNLDITINPDFSQVDVDRQVTNLSRFSLFFPEQRNFFIENSDVFDRFGFRQIKPFFSRKIGLHDGNIVPIAAGARLSGRINKDWRIGVMNIQTQKKSVLDLKAQNYTVAAIQRTVFKRSNISAIFVNRQTLENEKIIYSDYNRIAGADFNFSSDNNKWNGKAFYHHSFNTQSIKNNYAHASFLKFNNTHYILEWNHEFVGENYIADVGFVPRIYQYDPVSGETSRKAYWRFEDFAEYVYFFKNNKLNKQGFQLYYNQYSDAELNPTDKTLKGFYYIDFINTSGIRLNGYYNYVKLNFPIDVSFSGGDDTLPRGNYEYYNMDCSYHSSSINKLFYSAKINIGEYFIGKKYSINCEVRYRMQPWGNLTLSVSHDRITMPETFSNYSLYLIGPRMEVSVNKALFFSTFLQYNTQINNININSRLQWRFKPMSDLFIVYTDNYYSTDFGKKNKALVVKLVYWISV